MQSKMVETALLFSRDPPTPFLLSSPSSLWGSLMLHVNLCKKLVQTKRVDHYVIFFFSFSILNKTNRHLWGGFAKMFSELLNIEYRGM